MISIGSFEGPLDWLLEMARSKRIDLGAISILELVASFGEALDRALARPEGREPSLERWGDWVVMVATLTHLLSRLLVPANPDDAKAASDQAESFRLRLIERQRIAAAVEWLDSRMQIGRDVSRRGRPEVSVHPPAADITDLLRICLALLQVPEAVPVAWRPRPPPLWPVREALAHSQLLLSVLPSPSPLAAFLPSIAVDACDRDRRCREAVCSTVISALELARGATVALTLAGPWHPVDVEWPISARSG